MRNLSYTPLLFETPFKALAQGGTFLNNTVFLTVLMQGLPWLHRSYVPPPL